MEYRVQYSNNDEIDDEMEDGSSGRRSKKTQINSDEINQDTGFESQEDGNSDVSEESDNGLTESEVQRRRK